MTTPIHPFIQTEGTYSKWNTYIHKYTHTYNDTYIYCHPKAGARLRPLPTKMNLRSKRQTRYPPKTENALQGEKLTKIDKVKSSKFDKLFLSLTPYGK